MRVQFILVIVIIFFCTGGCISAPEKMSYTVYYYKVDDFIDIGTDKLTETGYAAICRLPTHGRTFWEQEFRYEDSSKSWNLKEVRMYKVVGDTLYRVEKADPHYIYSDSRDPNQLLLWGKDTVFTAVLFPMKLYTEYSPGSDITVYDSTYSVAIQRKAIEDIEDKKVRTGEIVKNLRKKLKIEGFWANHGLPDDYAIRYYGIVDMQVDDSLYQNVYKYFLRHTNPEVFQQYKRITRSFTRNYILLQESMGWKDSGFVYRAIQHEKPKFLPDCTPVAME